MEISWCGVYVSPIVPAAIVGVLVAWLITRILNWFDLARFVWYPPVFFLALAVICTGLVGRYLFPF